MKTLLRYSFCAVFICTILGLATMAQEDAETVSVAVETATEPSGAESSFPDSDKNNLSKAKETVRDEVNLRIATYLDRIDQLEKDLKGLQTAKVMVPSLLIPPKPDYPPKPIQKEPAPLKIGEFEEKESFDNRVKETKEKEAEAFRLEEVAYQLQVDSIDSKYEKLKRELETRHTELLEAENKRIARVKESLPKIQTETINQVATLRERIIEEKNLLARLDATSQFVPVLFRASYSELPWFSRDLSAFSGVSVICPKSTVTVENREYLIDFEYLTVNISFRSLEDAKKFKELSEQGLIYSYIVSDQSYWQSAVKSDFLPIRKTASETYPAVPSEDLLTTWHQETSYAPPPVLISRERASQAGSGELTLETTEGILNSTGLPIPDPLEALAFQNIRVYFGTEQEIFPYLLVTLDAAYSISRPATTSAASPASAGSVGNSSPEAKATPANKVHPIYQRGKNAGQRAVMMIDENEYAFRWCPPGVFRMGTGKNSFDATLTQGFWLLETEVTQAMYRNVMNSNPSTFRGDNMPVEYLTWNDCIEFCNRLTSIVAPASGKFSLPTEAQWEYACRAGSATDYSFGNNSVLLHQFGNYCDASNTDHWAWQDKVNNDGYDKTAPVGQFRPNAWGLLDMHGNVWEWCACRYGAYPRVATTNPTGPNNGTFRIFRGGSWSIDAPNCQSIVRFGFTPDFRRDDIGFRFCYVPFQ